MTRLIIHGVCAAAAGFVAALGVLAALRSLDSDYHTGEDYGRHRT